MGNGSIIRPGDGQRMTGTGVRHREANPSNTDAAHLLQVRILPDRKGHEPGYEKKVFSEVEKRGKLRLIASPGWRKRDRNHPPGCKLYVSLLGPGRQVKHELSHGRYAWVQVR